jgi:hypothetical protein
MDGNSDTQMAAELVRLKAELKALTTAANLVEKKAVMLGE